MKVTVAICPSCGYSIFSRSRHDFRWCPCKEIAIDGGADYVKLSFKNQPPKTVEIEVNTTIKELYDDWNLGKNKFGVYKEKKEKAEKKKKKAKT